MSTSNNHTRSDIDKPVEVSNSSKSVLGSNNEYTPFVRFAASPDEQDPILHNIEEATPEDANFVSPIYYLTSSERQFLKEWGATNPYAVSKSSIAKHLQDEAENEGRVRYPIYVESDAEVSLDTQVGWLKRFCREVLEVNPDSCSWFYSGHRSIHLHVPRLATERCLKELNSLSKGFEEEIDSKIYSRKRQFRLPGAIHDKTGLEKVPIDPDWDHDRIIREATQQEVEKPDSFREVLVNTFGPSVVETPERHLWQSQSPTDSGLYDWERHSFNMSPDTHRKWKAHYGSVVSPYANSGNGKRSLLVAEVVDGAFGEKRESHSEKREEQIDTILPSQVWRFWGCDRDFTATVDHRPIKLSTTDYHKIVDLDIEPGDYIAMIAGQSRSSRVFELSEYELNVVAGSKTAKDAINCLEYFDYETGESDLIESNRESSNEKNRESDPTATYHIQKHAEEEGVESLSHDERLSVMLRQLSLNGIEGARDWFEQQYGEQYDEELTNEQIESACNRFDWLPDYRNRRIDRRPI